MQAEGRGSNPVMDWYSQYVVAWRLSNTLEADFCIDALDEALGQGNPEIFNTDQGSQFTGQRFIRMLQDHLISRVLKTTERTLILQPQISSRSLLDRRRYLTIPVLGLLQLAPQPQTNETFGE